MLFPATLFLLFDPMNKVHFGRLRAQALALFVPSTLLGLLFESLSAGKLQSNSFTAAAHVERYVGKAQHELCSSWPMFSEAHKLLAIVC